MVHVLVLASSSTYMVSVHISMGFFVLCYPLCIYASTFKRSASPPSLPHRVSMAGARTVTDSPPSYSGSPSLFSWSTRPALAFTLLLMGSRTDTTVTICLGHHQFQRAVSLAEPETMSPLWPPRRWKAPTEILINLMGGDAGNVFTRTPFGLGILTLWYVFEFSLTPR